ncbi:MAG TPA: hypothetical protein VMB81_27380 [Candidatus Sulfotelmatobacter sp.]|nr:hypothetical protein [Candidatus Sulfotelmatobacter sp.]
MIGGGATRLALGLGGLILAGLPSSPAAAFGPHGHFGFHGGFVGVGFGFGCCYGPFGWSGYPYAGYPYPAYYGYPATYYAPITYSSAAFAPVTYTSAVAPIAASTGANIAAPAASAPAAVASDCREYQSRVLIGGRPQIAYGYACRQSDGSWRVAPR